MMKKKDTRRQPSPAQASAAFPGSRPAGGALPARRRGKGVRKTGWIAAAAFLADRVTKMLSVRIPPRGVTLIPGVLGLRQARNTGMAFSLLSGRPVLLGILSLAVIAGGLIALRKMNFRPLSRIGLMLMLGGAAGNAADRLITGYVPDLIEFLFVSFAVFNVADACIVIGCGLVMLDLFRGDRHG